MFKASLHGKDSFSEESGRVGEIIAPEQQAPATR